MARKGRKSKSKRGRRRVRCIMVPAYTPKKGKHAGRPVGPYARRVNPSLPEPVATGIGIAIGAAAGVAVAYAADKIGVLSPSARNWALMGTGIGGGVLLHRFSPAAAMSVGGGVAGVGLARALVTTLYTGALAPKPPAAPVAGLGNGSGTDIDGAYARLGRSSAWDRIGAVYPNGVGMVVSD